jgi:hypothetical protein
MSETDAAATILWASRQGFAKVLIVGEMPDGRTVIGHDVSLAEIRKTLSKASADLEFMASKALPRPA